MNKSALFPLLLLLVSPLIHADTIELNNGKTMQGTFIGNEGDTVKFEVDGINMSFQKKDVKNIAMGSTDKTSKTADNKAPAKSTASKPASVDAGTTLTIRLNEGLHSGKHTSGHKFSAVLEGALTKDGVNVAPAGSKVYGVISEAVKARRIAGDAKILITLTGIRINDQIVPVSTSAVNAITESTGKGTAGKVGKGAAIGALANGSDGAKDGAAIGLGIAILKGGNQVVVPAGTLLDFKLTAPLKTN